MIHGLFGVLLGVVDFCIGMTFDFIDTFCDLISCGIHFFTDMLLHFIDFFISLFRLFAGGNEERQGKYWYQAFDFHDFS